MNAIFFGKNNPEEYIISFEPIFLVNSVIKQLDWPISLAQQSRARLRAFLGPAHYYKTYRVVA